MDFGAKWCTRTNPRCIDCPLNSRCEAYRANKVGEYPSKTRRPTQPQITLNLLVILSHDNLVLLEKRPDNGIWPSLWVPPEIHNRDEKHHMYDVLGLHRGEIRREYSLQRFQHVLSHRRIEVSCDVTEIGDARSMDRSALNLQWCRIDERPRIGVPKITLRVFDALRSANEASN